MPVNDYPLTVRGRDLLGGSAFPEREYEIKLYDFKRPDKFSWEQIRTFSLMHETIARLLTVKLASIVGQPVEVGVSAVDQLTYMEFVDSTPEHSAFAVLNVPPLRGSMMMQIDDSLASLLVSSACGQRIDGLPLKRPGRPLTELELVILEAVVEELLPSIRSGWHHACPIEPRIGAMEGDRKMVMIVPPNEMIIMASLEVRIGENTAFINVPVPYLTIEEIIGRFSAKYWFSMVRPPGSARVGRNAQALRVGCEVAVPAGQISLSRLASVLSGEPLALPLMDEGTAELRAGSVPVARVGVTPDDLAKRELSLPVRETRRRRTTSPESPDHTGARARRHDELAELAEGMRALRVAVEELRDDRDAVAGGRITDQDSSTPPARPADDREARELALLLAGETGATIACYLAAIEPESAARLVSALDERRREEAVRALATLVEADRRLFSLISGFLHRRLRTVRDATLSGGPELVAAVLNHVPRAVEKAVMESFMQSDTPLFESIAQLMFVFEDFILVDQNAIAKVADRVAPDEWALALKGVPREVVSHILGAMGEDQVAAVHEAEARLGRSRRSDVESAQREIIEELRLLEERGEVVVARPDEVVE